MSSSDYYDKQDFINHKYYDNKKNDKFLMNFNKDIAFKNLIEMKKILEKNNIKFLPAFGTLLGLFRDKDLISHDIDIDIIIDFIFFEKFNSIFNQFINDGFSMVRSYHNGKLLTIEKNNEHIDFYFFKKVMMGNKFMYTLSESNYKFNYSFFEDQIKIVVKDETFEIPMQTESILELLYGKKWKIPLKGKNYHPDNLFQKKLKELYFKLPENIKKVFRKIRKILRLDNL